MPMIWCSPCLAAVCCDCPTGGTPHFLPARARAGLSNRFRILDLRHTAASLMIQAGYPPKMLQEIMGHASITTTLDLYDHLYPGDIDRYADRLDSAAGATDPARIRPDDDEDGQAAK
jgi:Phage integrase family